VLAGCFAAENFPPQAPTYQAFADWPLDAAGDPEALGWAAALDALDVGSDEPAVGDLLQATATSSPPIARLRICKSPDEFDERAARLFALAATTE
jgi:hypothetical protein